MANLYLSSGDNLSGLTFGGNVFGAAGSESVSYTSAATGVVVDQNVEEVKLAGTTSSYNFQQQGNQLLVLNGTTVVATIGVQGDANGTLISFANGRVEAKFVPGTPPTITLGTTTVPTTAGPVVPAVIDVTGGTGDQSLALTVGVDTIVGGAGGDTITGTYDPINNLHTLSGLDSIDGGAGIDTLALTDSDGGEIDLTLATIKNVEILNVRSVGGLASSTVNLAAALPGLTDATVDVKQGGILTLTASKTTTLNISNNDDVTIIGGGGASSIKAVGGDVIVGDSTFAAGQANAFTSVTANVADATGNVSGSVAVYDNSGTNGAVGTTLTSVTVQGINSDSVITGDGVTNVTLINNNDDVTITNSKAHALTLNVKAQANQYEVTDNTATSIAINATAAGATEFGSGLTNSDFFIYADKAASISVAGNDKLTLRNGDITALTAVTYAGSGSLTFDLTDVASVLASVDATGATGGLNITLDGKNSAGVSTAVVGGAGNDTVTIDGGNVTSYAGSLKLGAGSDTVRVDNGGVITASATIDAGEGTDTLALSIVGVSNIGAFSNFEVFDAVDLTGTLDVDILASKNTVTEITTSGDIGAAAVLTNVGAGVGYRVTADTDGTALTLTQKTAGALTVTLDIDEAATATTVLGDANATAIASNATSVKAVFDSSFVGVTTGGADNTAELAITGTAATTLSVVSGGANASNDLDYTVGASGGKGVLTSVTVTGTQALNLDLLGAGTTQVAAVNASGLSGALTFNLLDLKAATAEAVDDENQLFDGGKLTLGTGADVITATTATTGLTVAGIQKGTAEDQVTVGTSDQIQLAGAVQAADVADTGVYAVKDGLLTFSGAGPTTLAGAIGIAQQAADALNETVVFKYLNDSYIFSQNTAASASDDVIIKLEGTTGLAGLDTFGANTNVYVF